MDVTRHLNSQNPNEGRPTNTLSGFKTEKIMMELGSWTLKNELRDVLTINDYQYVIDLSSHMAVVPS